MKKLLFLLFMFIFSLNNVYADEKIEVKFDRCVDGDTAWFIYNNESSKFRFLAIDAPESTNKIEEFGKEASEFTCSKLTNAFKIEVEFDKNSNQKDKYDRYLAWIFVDNKLLQDSIVKRGFAKVDYLYGDYKYTNILKASENSAKIHKFGIWEDQYEYLYIYGSIVLGLVILLIIFNKKFRNKVRKNFIKKMNKRIEKEFKINPSLK